MNTSARNQFSGTVTTLTAGAVNDEVRLRTASGLELTATITRDSTAYLGLATGSQAIALIKASSIILADETPGIRFSARNRFAGTVSQVKLGAVNTEIVLDLDAGDGITAIITNESAQRLQLAVGHRAIALFKASSVILGVLE